MNTDLKTVLAWVLGTVIMLLLSLLTYFFNRIVDGQDKMNTTLTTILVEQRELTQRVTVLETAKTDNDEHWKEHEAFQRQFFETYELQRKK